MSKTLNYEDIKPARKKLKDKRTKTPRRLFKDAKPLHKPLREIKKRKPKRLKG